ncbi:MAG: hypothetical protein H0T89_14505 [Deltaproteobacteria bacterium]|nr:hypothetical protein [Deltaproteobacteria bacterium]MDQ3296191.1 hypothetical protein [Myxococcota bacterium]
MGILRSTLILLAVTLVASPAAADVDIAKADKLFAEGLALRESNLEQSCAKFNESLQYNPQAIGTLLNVALCDEKLGRIASAVVKFSEARDRAKEQQLADYIKAAEEHIASLTPELPYLQLKFGVAPIADTKILVNDQVVGMDRIGKLAVDPGEVSITVSAPGRLPYQTTIIVAKREMKDVEIPELEKSVTVKSSRRTIGLITTASGVAAIGAGVAIGLFARSSYNDAIKKCNQMTDPPQCPSEAQTDTEKARTLGTVGTVVGVIGIAAASVGIYMWLRAPKDTGERKVSLVPHVSSETAGLAAVGSF